MYKYLLFDADNTILDFDAAERLALSDTLLECPLGFSEKVFKRYHEINRLEWEKLERKETTLENLRRDRFISLFCEYGYSGEEGIKASQRYAKSLGKFAPLMPDAYNVLSQLYTKYDIYIVTNGISDVQRSRFSIAGLEKFAKDIFVSEEIGFEKPDKRYFNSVFEKTGDLEMSHYVIIGDSLTSDIIGAMNCGIDSIWLSYSGKKDERPTYTVGSLSEILNIL